MATIVLKYFKSGLVHGNIASENIEFKIKQIPSHHDMITDFRIVNYDFSYPFGVDKHTYFALDKKFAARSLPPEMINNLKLFYTK